MDERQQIRRLALALKERGVDKESGVIISLQVRNGDKRDRLMSWMRENSSATPEEIMDKALMLHLEAIEERGSLPKKEYTQHE